ncbi:nuclear transport factor 2 family protein [Brevundimonas sp.]|uniref:nuclear transport factor 2 family protein n=1 Tax=Brevundimonas sp. TaxID=1871086 RepID=UPI002D6779E5|nr:nuclear transport factor 2 family protein [Brevundimonas sp.]HYC68007.1 nuclear transport factor 2 family protein [Brevundimonas sp.]
MSRPSVALAAVLLALSAGPGLAQHGHDAPPARVAPAAGEAAAAVDAFHAALRAGDRDAALALLAEDALIFEAGGAERSKAEYASHHLEADAAFAAATEDAVTRRSGDVSGDVAWITSEGRTTGAFNGRPVDQITTETMLLRRHADGWRIQHIHWSSRAARAD